MATIPLPALGLKTPEQPDMFGNLAKALSVKNLQQESQRSTIETQQAQQGQLDQQAFRAAMTDPSMKGKTIGEIADALAGSGHISQASWVAAKKADVDQRKTFAELTEKDLINRAKSHEMTFDLYKNVMAMPDEQLATAWPQIAQQYDSIPGNKPILDPMKPLTKQQLGEMGPMLDMHEAYLASELAKRKAQNEAKTSGLKEAGNVLYDVTGEKPLAVAGNPPVEQQVLNSWLDTKQGNGKTRRENGMTAADFEQAKGTHTSTQSDSLGVTSTTTTAPSLNRGAGAPAGAPRAAGPASSLPAPGLLPPGSGKMKPAQIIDNIVDMVGQYRYNPTQLARLQVKHPEIVAAINQKYPDWDQTTYNAKNQIVQKYTSGPESSSINAISTALGHAGELGEAIDALHNGDAGLKTLRGIANKLGVETGGDAVTTFNTIVHRLGPEITSAYIKGGGGEGERISNAEDFSPSLADKQLRGNLGITVKLLRSKIEAQEQQWNNTYKPTRPEDAFAMRFLTPRAQTALQKWSPQQGGQPGAANPHADLNFRPE